MTRDALGQCCCRPSVARPDQRRPRDQTHSPTCIRATTITGTSVIEPQFIFADPLSLRVVHSSCTCATWHDIVSVGTSSSGTTVCRTVCPAPISSFRLISSLAARYVISAGEFHYWQAVPRNEIADQHAGFADSVRPVYEAGLVDLVADNHWVTEGTRLVPSPGHTPHHADRIQRAFAVITGDVMHHPCQIAYPAWAAVSDFDSDQARASRRELVQRCADADTLVIGTHFPDPVAGRHPATGHDIPPDAIGS